MEFQSQLSWKPQKIDNLVFVLNAVFMFSFTPQLQYQAEQGVSVLLSRKSLSCHRPSPFQSSTLMPCSTKYRAGH